MVAPTIVAAASTGADSTAWGKLGAVDPSSDMKPIGPAAEEPLPTVVCTMFETICPDCTPVFDSNPAKPGPVAT